MVESISIIKLEPHYEFRIKEILDCFTEIKNIFILLPTDWDITDPIPGKYSLHKVRDINFSIPSSLLKENFIKILIILELIRKNRKLAISNMKPPYDFLLGITAKEQQILLLD